tara:strand:+ start:8811 stop:9443 length:633 start_codon:yes stop_codon:yes gene_type:complete
MSTAFQWVFDNAASIGINKSPVVAQTTSRNQTVRATSRGGSIWRFDVAMPAGQLWTEARPYITAIEQLDRHSTGTVQINTAGYSSWLSKYQGVADTTSGFAATWTTGNTVTLSTVPAGANLTTGEVVLKAGDWIQLGSSGSVYEVAVDVIHPSTTVTLNRPLIDDAGTASLLIGPAVTWTVICTSMPTWSIVDKNIVSFSGNFSFYEALA